MTSIRSLEHQINKIRRHRSNVERNHRHKSYIRKQLGHVNKDTLIQEINTLSKSNVEAKFKNDKLIDDILKTRNAYTPDIGRYELVKTEERLIKAKLSFASLVKQANPEWQKVIDDPQAYEKMNVTYNGQRRRYRDFIRYRDSKPDISQSCFIQENEEISVQQSAVKADIPKLSRNVKKQKSKILEYLRSNYNKPHASQDKIEQNSKANPKKSTFINLDDIQKPFTVSTNKETLSKIQKQQQLKKINISRINYKPPEIQNPKFQKSTPDSNLDLEEIIVKLKANNSINSRLPDKYTNL